MWVRTTPWTALSWTLAGLAAHNGVQVWLHRRRRSVYVSELKSLTRSEIAASAAFLCAWIALELVLFSELETPGSRSLVDRLELTVDFRTVLGCITTLTMSCVLYSGTFLQAILTDDLSSYLSSLCFLSPLFISLYNEFLFRLSFASLLRYSGVSCLVTTCVVMVCSGIGSLHLCYYFGRIRRSWSRALAEVVTTDVAEQLFIGFFATRMFLITGRIYPSLVLQSFVSVLHIPDDYFLHQSHPGYRYRRLLGSTYIVSVLAFLLLHLSLLDPSVYASPLY